MFDDRLLELEKELERREREATVNITYKQAWSLHRFLEHGDRAHREWLAKAILCWALGKPRPEEVQFKDG